MPSLWKNKKKYKNHYLDARVKQIEQDINIISSTLEDQVSINDILLRGGLSANYQTDNTVTRFASNLLNSSSALDSPNCEMIHNSIILDSTDDDDDFTFAYPRALPRSRTTAAQDDMRSRRVPFFKRRLLTKDRRQITKPASHQVRQKWSAFRNKNNDRTRTYSDWLKGLTSARQLAKDSTDRRRKFKDFYQTVSNVTPIAGTSRLNETGSGVVATSQNVIDVLPRKCESEDEEKKTIKATKFCPMSIFKKKSVDGTEIVTKKSDLKYPPLKIATVPKDVVSEHTPSTSETDSNLAENQTPVDKEHIFKTFRHLIQLKGEKEKELQLRRQIKMNMVAITPAQDEKCNKMVGIQIDSSNEKQQVEERLHSAVAIDCRSPGCPEDLSTGNGNKSKEDLMKLVKETKEICTNVFQLLNKLMQADCSKNSTVQKHEISSTSGEITKGHSMTAQTLREMLQTEFNKLISNKIFTTLSEQSNHLVHQNNKMADLIQRINVTSKNLINLQHSLGAVIADKNDEFARMKTSLDQLRIRLNVRTDQFENVTKAVLSNSKELSNVRNDIKTLLNYCALPANGNEKTIKLNPPFQSNNKYATFMDQNDVFTSNISSLPLPSTSGLMFFNDKNEPKTNNKKKPTKWLFDDVGHLPGWNFSDLEPEQANLKYNKPALKDTQVLVCSSTAEVNMSDKTTTKLTPMQQANLDSTKRESQVMQATCSKVTLKRGKPNTTGRIIYDMPPIEQRMISTGLSPKAAAKPPIYQHNDVIVSPEATSSIPAGHVKDKKNNETSVDEPARTSASDINPSPNEEIATCKVQSTKPVLKTKADEEVKLKSAPNANKEATEANLPIESSSSCISVTSWQSSESNKTFVSFLSYTPERKSKEDVREGKAVEEICGKQQEDVLETAASKKVSSQKDVFPENDIGVTEPESDLKVHKSANGVSEISVTDMTCSMSGSSSSFLSFPSTSDFSFSETEMKDNGSQSNEEKTDLKNDVLWNSNHKECQKIEDKITSLMELLTKRDINRQLQTSELDKLCVKLKETCTLCDERDEMYRKTVNNYKEQLDEKRSQLMKQEWQMENLRNENMKCNSTITEMESKMKKLNTELSEKDDILGCLQIENRQLKGMITELDSKIMVNEGIIEEMKSANQTLSDKLHKLKKQQASGSGKTHTKSRENPETVAECLPQ